MCVLVLFGASRQPMTPRVTNQPRAAADWTLGLTNQPRPQNLMGYLLALNSIKVCVVGGPLSQRLAAPQALSSAEGCKAY